MFAKLFWKRAAERAVKSAGQALVLGIGTAASFDAVHADWAYLGSVTLGGAVLSIATSLASLPVGSGDDPSVVE